MGTLFLATVAHLLGKSLEGACDLASGVVGEDADADGGRLCGRYCAGDDRIEHLVSAAILRTDGPLDLVGEVIATVGERDEDALDGKRGVDLPPYAPDGLQESGHGRGGKVLGRHRNKHTVRCDEGIDRDDAERGCAVEDDEVVVRFEWRDPHVGKLFARHRHQNRHLHARQLDVRRHEVDALLVRENALAGIEGCALYDGVQMIGERRLKSVGVFPSKRFGEVALRVGVNEQDALSAPGESNPKAEGGCRLAGAALLVGDGDGSAWHDACTSFCGFPHREVRRCASRGANRPAFRENTGSALEKSGFLEKLR